SSGLASRKEAEDQLAPLAGQVAFRYLPEMSMSQIVDVLHSLSPGSLVLAFSFGRDKDGKIFNHDELARVLSSNSPVPVYGTKKERLGFGIIGGRLLDGQSHGAAGAELALQVLAGADPDLLPVIANPQSPLYFDYQVLKRFRIPLGRLPANSILVNRPPGFYSQHKQVIDTAAIIIAILSFSLVTVIINNRSRRRAEAALRESERYRFLFVNASDAILILNAAGQVLDVNAIACDLLGHSRESLMAMTLADLMPPTWLATADAAHGGIQQSGHCVFESVLLRQDGTPLPVEISSRRLVFRGEPAILISFRDITDRQHAEEEIRKLNAELEERVQRRTRELALANEEMEAFCYSVSHDLRGPLRHINGYGTILMEEHSRQLDDGAREYLTRLRRASRHMGQLIDDLLKLSQVSRSEMVLGEVNLSTLAREVMTELQQANPERRVACAITDGIVATGDARLLRVVLDNLLGNAWKYTSHKEVATIEFGTTRENGTTAYFVRDDGAGFDMTYADKLFGPFQRLHRSDEFEGTGIGLATVQRIILRHGGQVWGIGKPGQGATFWFTLGT
ncbi:MAG TPA: ATP-binding protein, partial [Geobacteraceae bacterium]